MLHPSNLFRPGRFFQKHHMGFMFQGTHVGKCSSFGGEMRFGCGGKGHTAFSLFMPTVMPWQCFMNHRKRSNKKASTWQLLPASPFEKKKKSIKKKKKHTLQKLEGKKKILHWRCLREKPRACLY